MDLYTDRLDRISYADMDAWATQQPIPAEDERLEFKADWSDSITETIVAMANRHGGVILVGVAEDRAGGANRLVWPPAGVSKAKRPLGKLGSVCHQHIRPDYAPEAVMVDIPDKDDLCIVVIRVDAATAPRPLWHQTKGVAFRVGEQVRPADLDTLRRLFAEQQQRPNEILFREETATVPDNGCWIRCIVRAPHPFDRFGTQEKQTLAHIVGHWFAAFDRTKHPSEAYLRWSGTSSSRHLLLERRPRNVPGQPGIEIWPRRFFFHRDGIYSSACQPPQVEQREQIDATLIVDELVRSLSMLACPEAQGITPFRSVDLELRVDNLPAEGVNGGMWVHGQPWLQGTVEPTRVVSWGPINLTQETVDPQIEALVSDLMADSGLVAYEGHLHSYFATRGWWASPPAGQEIQ